ncbi:TIGR03857 family LLM class F420-dependent oxidoreductase [Mycolicibacterium alvei]|uniref:LLM class F420-dependent oxidoreductase n=1 Tax=Mycolicibacterium alvei TaxID=67081 RepID=A0A6N4UPM6_9MYCO|nr:TIGR03857 family LLM class F420-dependent oxidoreductase [Mycolicibacterium alvei]MCV7000776.1 TIGR03857 family LLM class F420-dependent oxidoreductase [Mycolicibacterium alvei]BBX27006.1 LLM class F420-dependent oxidoreductase [Mycolicibacterium alvei]
MDTEISSGVPLGAYTLPGRVADPRAAIVQAEAAERLGLRTLWLSERWGTKDLGVLAGALSQATSTLRIASGITHFQSRHPALLASLAMTAQGLSDGRFVLGVGRSVDAMWDAVGLPRSANASIVDYADIFRRLCRGEKVRYDGPAGKYPSLRLNDIPDQPVPPLVFAAIGSKGLALAGRHFDGVLLHPFLTPAAVARSVAVVREAEKSAGRPVGSVRVYATVVVACDLPAADELAVVGARAVTYYQIPGFGERLAAVNGWDVEPLQSLRSHPLLADIKGSADSVLTREQLVEVASVLPTAWTGEAAAVGSALRCHQVFASYREAGADELVLHGSTPDLIGPLFPTIKVGLEQE